MKWIRQLSNQALISIAILASCLLIAYLLILSRKQVAKEEITAKPTLVEIIEAKKENAEASVSAFGTVQANRMLSVHPQVSGVIVKQSEHLVLGGLLQKGKLMLKIDPRDYLIAVEQAKASVEKAEFELQVELGKQVVAEREWELLDASIGSESKIGKELALRIPHMREKKAALAGAKSKLAKAKLDLDRTTIYAPFNAVVIDESIEEGEVINPQSVVATLASTNTFRIQVSIPFSQLRWIDLSPEAAEVIVSQEIGDGQIQTWKGKILRILGSVESKSRMARILVAIPDPLGVTNPEYRSRPLLIGTYVRVEIKGPTLKDVFVIPRGALREGNKVWLKNGNNELQIRPVHIVLKRKDTIIIDKGLHDGDEIVTSNLSIAIPGMILETFE